MKLAHANVQEVVFATLTEFSDESILLCYIVVSSMVYSLHCLCIGIKCESASVKLSQVDVDLIVNERI